MTMNPWGKCVVVERCACLPPSLTLVPNHIHSCHSLHFPDGTNSRIFYAVFRIKTDKASSFSNQACKLYLWHTHVKKIIARTIARIIPTFPDNIIAQIFSTTFCFLPDFPQPPLFPWLLQIFQKKLSTLNTVWWQWQACVNDVNHDCTWMSGNRAAANWTIEQLQSTNSAERLEYKLNSCNAKKPSPSISIIIIIISSSSSTYVVSVFPPLVVACDVRSTHQAQQLRSESSLHKSQCLQATSTETQSQPCCQRLSCNTPAASP